MLPLKVVVAQLLSVLPSSLSLLLGELGKELASLTGEQFGSIGVGLSEYS